jgi:hypothetical protein
MFIKVLVPFNKYCDSRLDPDKNQNLTDCHDQIV